MNRIDTLRGPLLVSWQMTRDCSLACVHCCTSSAPGLALPDEMDRNAALSFADAIVRAEIPYVMLCGGEPMLVPHFMKVAERLGAAGVQLKIETNGHHLDASAAARLARLPIRSVQISLDGDTDAVYRRQRPGGSLRLAHAACRMVTEAGMKLEITFAPTRYNIHEAAHVMARARQLGAFRFNTGALMPVGRAFRSWNKISPSKEALAQYKQFLDRQAARLDRTMQLCYEPFTVSEGLKQSLATPPATLLVFSNGLVGLVGPIDYICGDVRHMDLARIWRRYRAAWRDKAVIGLLTQAIHEAPGHAGPAAGTPVLQGVLENA